MRKLFFALAMTTLARISAAGAQDLPVSHIEDHAHVVRQGMLNRSLNGQRSTSYKRSDGLDAESRSYCRNKRQLAANLGPEKGRRLYALCAQAGY